MTIGDILKRIMKDDVDAEDQVKIKLGNYDYEVIDLVQSGNGTVFIRLGGRTYDHKGDCAK